jgi:pimeloyl-ACP methyl ester carboxylesterase
VLLHDYKDTRATFAPLAERLQAPGDEEPSRPSFAVVTLDLRGHGESTVQLLPNGQQVELNAARIDKNSLFAMAAYDMEALRAYLVAKNDAGELNLNKLSLVGAGMGASVAANWALQDWSAPPLAVGKQGQDVKALSLISPRWSYRGLSMRAPMRSRPLAQAARWQLIYGKEEPEAAADARRIENQLERFHPAPAGGAAAQPRGLVVIPWESKLQGGTLLTRVGAPIEQQIVKFLVENVASKELPWSSRRTRLP